MGLLLLHFDVDDVRDARKSGPRARPGSEFWKFSEMTPA